MEGGRGEGLNESWMQAATEAALLVSGCKKCVQDTSGREGDAY